KTASNCFHFERPFLNLTIILYYLTTHCKCKICSLCPSSLSLSSSLLEQLTTTDIANAVTYALTQPAYVCVNEITVRPVQPYTNKTYFFIDMKRYKIYSVQ